MDRRLVGAQCIFGAASVPEPLCCRILASSVARVRCVLLLRRAITFQALLPEVAAAYLSKRLGLPIAGISQGLGSKNHRPSRGTLSIGSVWTSPPCPATQNCRDKAGHVSITPASAPVHMYKGPIYAVRVFTCFPCSCSKQNIVLFPTRPWHSAQSTVAEGADPSTVCVCSRAGSTLSNILAMVLHFVIFQ